MARMPALAVTLPQFRPEPGTALSALEDSYRLGYAGGFLFDHLWPLGQPDRPALECWTLLAALGGRLSALTAAGGEASAGSPGAGVERSDGAAAGAGRAGAFRIGTLVTRAGLRPPALLAHMARTVGTAAGAPPIVGIGMGDAGNRPENRAFGIPDHADPTRRAAELVRNVDALRGPLAGRPAPAVWVGGTSRRARGLAGRVADAWNGWGLDPDELAAGLTEVRRAAEDAGRDPGTVDGTWGGQVLVDDDGARALAMLARWGAGRSPAEVARTVAGDGAAVARRLRELGEAGASWCVLAFVGGSAARMRGLLADACEVSGRSAGAARYDP
jgi:alkanesulfonate monooxygenase SsuD/methylene tetrahydromethanopterin reductase-like flavin-dependent oxidoreductase (luciferase family)